MQILKTKILLLACAVSLACVGCNSEPAPSKVAAAAPAPVAVTRTAVEPVTSYTTTAPIFTENEIEVVSQREGVVDEVKVDLGQRVHKGEVLATLDDRQLQSAYDAAIAKSKGLAADSKNWQAEAKMAEADEQRAKAMFDANLMTKEQYDHAKYKTVASQYEVERQQQEQLNAEHAAATLSFELQKTKIVAPFDGVIARRYIRRGQHVAAADKLFWVVGDTPLRVRFLVPEASMALAKNGARVQLASVYTSDVKVAGKIVAVSPAVDPATGSIEVVAELDRNSSMKSGMTAQVTLSQK